MRRAAKIDANQAAIVDALRKAGCTVLSLAAVGKGAPDLLVGKQGRNFILECKDGKKPPSARALTDPQCAFHQSWKGQIAIVESVDDALRVVAWA